MQTIQTNHYPDYLKQLKSIQKNSKLSLNNKKIKQESGVIDPNTIISLRILKTCYCAILQSQGTSSLDCYCGKKVAILSKVALVKMKMRNILIKAKKSLVKKAAIYLDFGSLELGGGLILQRLSYLLTERR